MSNGSEKRFVFNFLFLLVGGLYLIRLFYLQVIDETYARYAQINVLHPTVIYPSRGLILDRNGELLVFNDAIYDLMVIPDKIEGMDTTDFCKLLKLTRQDFLDRFEDMKKQKGWAPWKSQVFEKQLDVRTYAAFQEKLFDFPGFYVEVRTDRNYKINNAAHILGYIGEVTDKDIDESNGYYRAGDFIGISGIEKAYEDRLRGHKGVKYILVDVLNREQGSYKNGTFDSAALAGENLTTTLDLKLQQLGEELMQNKIGSVVAIEPKTGEILAMVSSPGYDPNLFIGRDRAKNYLKLLRDPLKPLFNRPIAAPYPPGSIFKIIMALVGQQEGVLTPETQYSCARGYNNGSNFVGCHPHGSPLNLRGAVQISCNAYFCHVFKTVIDNKRYVYVDQAFEKWRKHIMSFGLGTRLGIELPNVSKGLVPTVGMYNKVYGEHHWKASTVISLAIGQGELGITPLQMANVTAILANRGWYITPHVAKYFGNDKSPLKEFSEKHKTTVDPKYYDVVIEGMRDVVTGGTGIIANIPGLDVCGKTGTAQNPHGKDHSVFIAFAPMNDPKIAIAVVVENAGFGASWAAPIAALMMEQYLNDSIAGNRKYLYDRMVKADLIHLPGSDSKKDSTHQKPNKDAIKVTDD